MKLFETTLLFTAMQAIAFGEEVNSQNSPSDFKMQRYGTHAAEYYYDSYTPRSPDSDLPRRQYYPDRPPVRQMHHYDRTNDGSPEDNYSKPDSHFAETHSIEGVHVRPHWDETMTHAEPEYSHLHFQDPAKDHEPEQPHDYLVMHRPKAGKKHGTYSEEKSNPHFDQDGKYIDENLPIYKPPNVDPPQTKTPKKEETPSKRVPIEHPEDQPATKEGFMVAHRPAYGKHEAPKISYVEKQPVNEKHTYEEDLHVDHPHDVEHYFKRRYMSHSNDYHELETPHSLEPFKSKSVHDPTVHYHDYHDYPPEFYKAEYYGNYHKLSEDMMSPEQYYRQRVLNHDDHHLPYEPLQVHSWADNGFFYYDDHPQTSFRDETGYEAYMAGHQTGPRQFYGDPYQQPVMDEGLYSHRVHEADIHSSGQMIYDHYRNSGLDESDENFSFMGAMKSAASTGMTFAKGMTGKGEPGSESSWTSMAGQVVGGALGTGGAESGGMAGKIGQMIGGATGTAGGDDGSMGARIGSTVGGMMGIPKKEKPEPVPGEEKKPSYIEQLPGIVGSMTGETRMKGCWKKAYFRGLGEVKSQCANDMTRSGQWCYAQCQDGYTGYNKTCYKDCPADAPSRYMATCQRHKSYPRGPASTQPCTGCTKIGLKYYEDCKSGYSAMGSKCKGLCPDGTKDAGWQGCKKATYQRQTAAATCRDDQQSQTPFCYPKCTGDAFGLGPVCFGKCPADKTQCMGILCLDAGEKCSTKFAGMYKRVQKTVLSFMTNTKIQGLIDFGKLVGDNAPMCPTW